ncbi:peptidoglycan DD-metalloendopeptidase family protein [Flindersiella endophytica]
MALVAALIACGVAAGALAVVGEPQAQAKPKDDLKKVERQLHGAKEDLDESSADLKQATTALRSAEVQLGTARKKLADVHGRLVAAKARDRASAKALQAAQHAVDKAKAELADAEQKVRDQRRQIGAFANATYQQRNVDDITAILASGDPQELVDRMQMVDSITASQADALERFNALRADVASRKAALEVLEQRAEQRRAEAAANLVRMRELERQAKQAEAKVEQLVADRHAARQAAQRAKADDERRYDALVAERGRIQRMLAEIARKEAAAERERQRRERERERRERDNGGDNGGGNDDSGGGGDGGSGLSYPVSAPITSPYGMRFHPVLHRWKLHDGTDFGAGCGTPVHAAAGGRVIARYYNAGYGNRVLISHGWMSGKSTVTAYNHLSGYAVHVGERVSRGETVGYVGTTGYSTGCHLHFMVYRNGSTVNPMYFL